VIFLTSAYGLGENVVAGRVDPDEYLISKPLLGKAPMPILRRKLGAKQLKMVYSGHGSRTTKNIEVSPADRESFSVSDADAIRLCEWAAIIEDYYSELNRRDTPMDIEWGKDGRTGELFILQARPETVHAGAAKLQSSAFVLAERSTVLCKGRAVGTKIGAGRVRFISGVSELFKFQPGEVLVTDMTDPDWEPVMKKAAAIVTNRGGRTCHAAIPAWWAPAARRRFLKTDKR
jgi:pyruvate,water dikinase